MQLVGAAWLTTAGGHTLADGDTMGGEGDTREAAYRVRHLPKEATESSLDVVAIIHPQSPFDADAVAGPIESRPPPEGVDNSIIGDPSAFKADLNRPRAHAVH